MEDPAGFARGTFGTLYLARRVSDNAKVAMKLVLLTSAGDARERLEAERHGAMLQQRFARAHGMVPEVYEYGPYNEHLYIAMEFVEGQSLATRIRQGLTPEAAARHAAGICDFLDKAHQFETTIEDVRYDRIVHADLKPEHVLIASSGDMKVLDFGIAKALEKTTEVTTNNWSTVAYASPERLHSGGQVNVHADFWSLGVMLYEMVSGHLPYPALTPRHMRSQLEQAIRTNAQPEPLPLTCSPNLAAIIRKLMAHQIEHRYPTAAAIRSDLDRFLLGDAPAAAAQYEIAPTVPIRRSATTDRAPYRPVQVVPPTEPFPVAGGSAVAVADPVTPVAGVPAVRARMPRVRRRVAWFVAQLAAVAMVAAEGGAWVSAERFRHGIQSLEGRTIAQKYRQYDDIRSWSLFDMGLRKRVDQPLKQRLVALTDTVIADYRRDGPTMSAAEWRQADEAMKWALELDPWDSRLRARRAICEAHLARFASRVHRRGTDASREAYRAAIARFEEAAALDDSSFDPYLGISNIQAYGLDDVELAAEAIERAEKRGYVPGRRERAQLGDGYLKRADRTRRRALSLSGDARRVELEKARDDYARCVERFGPIQDFGRSRANMEYCRSHRDRIGDELDPVFSFPWVM
ncbi:MAG: serine/threonine protein kinase [Vicinamibacterales bacterium]